MDLTLRENNKGIIIFNDQKIVATIRKLEDENGFMTKIAGYEKFPVKIFKTKKEAINTVKKILNNMIKENEQ